MIAACRRGAAQPKSVETIAVANCFQGDVIKIVLATAGVREGGQYFGEREDETFPKNSPLLVPKLPALRGFARHAATFEAAVGGGTHRMTAMPTFTLTISWKGSTALACCAEGWKSMRPPRFLRSAAPWRAQP